MHKPWNRQTGCTGMARAIGFLFLVVTTSLGLSRTVQAGPHDVAIIIANKDYAHTAPVAYAFNDAKDLRKVAMDVLRIPAANIVERQNASLTDFIRLFEEPQSNSGTIQSLVRNPAARIFAFYVGHGVPGRVSSGSYERFLLPVEARPEESYLTGYPLAKVQRALEIIGARLAPEGQVFLIMDACFSGNSATGELIKGASAGRIPVSLAPAPRLVQLAAARSDQVAWWDEQRGHGLFTDALLDALYGGAAEGGKVTLAGVERFIHARMAERLAALAPAGRQQRADVFGDGALILADLSAGDVPARDPEQQTYEALQCRLMSDENNPQRIEEFLSRCRTCTPDCRAGLERRAGGFRAAERAKANTCSTNRRVWEDIVKSGDAEAAHRFLRIADCEAVKVEATAWLAAEAAKKAEAEARDKLARAAPPDTLKGPPSSAPGPGRVGPPDPKPDVYFQDTTNDPGDETSFLRMSPGLTYEAYESFRTTRLGWNAVKGLRSAAPHEYIVSECSSCPYRLLKCRVALAGPSDPRVKKAKIFGDMPSRLKNPLTGATVTTPTSPDAQTVRSLQQNAIHCIATNLGFGRPSNTGVVEPPMEPPLAPRGAPAAGHEGAGITLTAPERLPSALDINPEGVHAAEEAAIRRAGASWPTSLFYRMTRQWKGVSQNNLTAEDLRKYFKVRQLWDAIKGLPFVAPHEYQIRACADCNSVALSCNAALAGLAELRRKKIRLDSNALAKTRGWITRLGATIQAVSDAQVVKALQQNSIHCIAADLGADDKDIEVVTLPAAPKGRPSPSDYFPEGGIPPKPSSETIARGGIPKSPLTDYDIPEGVKPPRGAPGVHLSGVVATTAIWPTSSGMWPLANHFELDSAVWVEFLKTHDQKTWAHLSKLSRNAYLVQECAAECHAIAVVCNVALADRSGIRGKKIFVSSAASAEARNTITRLGAMMMKGPDLSMWKDFRDGRIQCMAGSIGK